MNILTAKDSGNEPVLNWDRFVDVGNHRAAGILALIALTRGNKRQKKPNYRTLIKEPNAKIWKMRTSPRASLHQTPKYS